MERARTSIDFDRLVEAYSASLVETLRGHGATGNFLEHWVPDTDPVLGLVNLVEAAQTEGVDAIDVTVSRHSLPSSALPQLRAAFADFASIEIEPWGAGLRLRIDKIDRRKLRPVPAPADSVLARPRARRDSASDSTDGNRRLHPALLPAVQRIPFPPAAPATGDGFELELGEGDVVLDARSARTGDDLRDRLFALAATLAVGRPVADLRDHVGTLMVAQLRALAPNGGARLAAGILLPANSGEAVVEVVRAVRAACDRMRPHLKDLKAINFFDPGPSIAWRALDDAARAERIVRVFADFTAEENLPPDALEFVALDRDILEHPVRVLARVSGRVAPGDKPDFMRRVEARLKAAVEARLELHLEPLKDKNALRRL